MYSNRPFGTKEVRRSERSRKKARSIFFRERTEERSKTKRYPSGCTKKKG